MALIPYEKQQDVWEEVKDKIRHEPLPDLQGGKDGEHYHLTYDELEHLRGVSEEIKDAIDGVKHEELPDLLGGSSDGHYHLTPSELAQLRGMGQTIEDALKKVHHEELPDLLGGTDNGHYHLTEAELTKLRNTPATIDVGTVTTGAAGTQASVIRSGTATNMLLNFVIPKGDKGDAGQNGLNGQDGKVATIRVGTTTTGAAGSEARVTNGGTDNEAVLNFTIPRGATGATGAPGVQGPQGPDGRAATIRLGTVSTGAPNSNVSITNSGTENAAVFNFTIPRGATGAAGANGTNGVTPTISIGTVTTVAANSKAEVTKSGTASNVVLNFKIPKGDTGAGANVPIYDKLDAQNTAYYKSTAALSAYQGKVLNDLITANRLTVYNYASQAYLPNIKTVASSNTTVLSAFAGRLLYEKILEVQNSLNLTVNNFTAANLSSIGGVSSSDKHVLSTYTGRLLYEKINAVDQKIGNTKLNTETWTFTLVNGTTVTKKVAIG
ncbi:MAG: collagen-like protein [Synergistaceae bacterium]|nr:collagen-like protein [Synergistaceae bacterium]